MVQFFLLGGVRKRAFSGLHHVRYYQFQVLSLTQVFRTSVSVLAAAVEDTLLAVARQPDLGWLRHFKNPRLTGLRSIPFARPFYRPIIFYRAEAEMVEAWRLMHGARDLPRRLPGQE